MKRTGTFFRGLTAADAVIRRPLVIPQDMSLVPAARLLLERRLRAAPVADASGRCVGVLSVADALRGSLEAARAGAGEAPPTSCVWCDWEVVADRPTGRDEVLRYMRRHPLLVTPDRRLWDIAGALMGPDRRPVVVVDEDRRPLGVLASEDVLAALAFAEYQPEDEPPAEAATDRRGSPRPPVQVSIRVDQKPEGART